MNVIQGLKLDSLYFSIKCEVFGPQDQLFRGIENCVIFLRNIGHARFVILLISPFLTLFRRFRIVVLIICGLVFTDYLEQFFVNCVCLVPSELLSILVVAIWVNSNEIRIGFCDLFNLSNCFFLGWGQSFLHASFSKIVVTISAFKIIISIVIRLQIGMFRFCFLNLFLLIFTPSCPRFIVDRNRRMILDWSLALICEDFKFTAFLVSKAVLPHFFSLLLDLQLFFVLKWVLCNRLLRRLLLWL